MFRILVIDDDLNMRETIRDILSGEDYEILISADARLGLEMHSIKPFDLIITDIIMPDMDGIEVILQLRKKYPETKIIAISGGGYYFADDYLETARILGADKVIEKPFENNYLAEIVFTLLHK